MFPDLSSLLKIVDRLWVDQAALLVGAGMSRNAMAQTPNAPPFADWRGLAKAMREQLYAGDDSTDGGARGTPRLAGEYESAYGRSALVQLITEHVPDTLYRPGDLHVRLVDLPWQDVFTTNYDTLLERAGKKSERYYGVVRCPEDLPQRASPRIVKLHGGLPSDLPLIVTEEDYRTYPQDFAPFVHLVQTSLMEHAFVLIGFSGDDPNFLSWRGWLQDQLGKHAPPIYLCGVLDLASSRRGLLKRQGVQPIDLGPLFPKEKWPRTGKRHAAALNWLMTTFEAGEPRDPLKWPKKKSGQTILLPKAYPSLPVKLKDGKKKVSPDSLLKATSENIAEQMSGPDEQELKRLIQTWQEERQSYPGWVIAPQKVRDRIWSKTEEFTRHCWRGDIDISGKLVEIGEGMKAPEDISFLYELSWRQTLAVVPMMGEQPEVVEQVLKNYNPGSQPKDSESDHSLGTEGPSEFNWEYLTNAWFHLSLAILRHARRNLKEDKFESWSKRLESLTSENPEWEARLNYERALFRLSLLDLQGAHAVLNEWSASTGKNFPFGETYRARVLAELGRIDEADRVSETGLKRILEAQTATNKPNIPLLSQEGWTRRLRSVIEVSRDFFPRLSTEEWAKRLRNYDSDPEEIVDSVTADVNSSNPVLKPDRSEVSGFDPQRQSTTYHGGPKVDFSDHKPGLEYLWILEAGGQALRVGNLSIDAQLTLRAANLARPIIPATALTASLRLAYKKSRTKDEEGTDTFFSRTRVTGFGTEGVEELYGYLIQGLRHSIAFEKQRGEGTFDLSYNRSGLARSGAVWLEILSRFTIRLSDDRTVNIIRACIEFCQLQRIKKDNSLHRLLGSALGRTLDNTSSQAVTRIAPEVLRMPMPGDDGIQGPTAQQWPEVGSRLKNLEDDTLSIPNSLTTSLLERAESGDSHERTHALSRLRYIYANDGMSEDQEKEFANVLWSQNNDHGIPNLSFFLPGFVLTCPEPEPGYAKRSLKKYLLEEEVPRVVFKNEEGEPTGSGVSQSGTKHIQTLIASTQPRSHRQDEKEDVTDERYIDWLEAEAVQLLKRIVAWWDNDKTGLDRREDESPLRALSMMGQDTIRHNLNTIPAALREVILPRLSNASEGVAKAGELIQEMDEAGFNIHSTLPHLERLDNIKDDEAATQIRKGLANSETETVGEAAKAVLEWTRVQGTDLPTDLLTYLVYTVAARKDLNIATRALTQITEESPQKLSEDHLRRLFEALDYLLESTSPPSPDDVWFESELSREDIPTQRAVAASLARALYDYREVHTVEVDGNEVLDEWRATTESSPLPEVRQAWADLQ